MATTNSRRLISNTIINMVSQVLAAVIGFALVGFFLSQIGEDRYGVWILVGSLFAYKSLMSMGLNSAVNRYVPVHLAEDDMDGVVRVVSTAFAYFLIPSAVLAATAFLFYVHFADWFSVPPELVEEGRQLAIIVGVSFAISLPFQVYNAVLTSYQRFDLVNLSLMTTILGRTIAVVPLLLDGHGLIAMGYTYAAGEIAGRLVAVVAAVRLMGGFRLSAKAVDLRFLGEMFGYGTSTILYLSGSVVIFQSAELVIGALISAAAVSRFHVGVTPILLLITAIQVFARAVKPAVSDLDARSEHGRIEEMALLGQKYTVAVILLATAYLVLLGERFFDVWIGDRYTDATAIGEIAGVATALVIGAASRLTQYTNFIVLVGKGTHRVFGIVAVTTVILGILASIGVILLAGGGIVAVAWACVVPMIVASLGILPFYFSSAMGIPLGQSIRESWLPAIFSAAPGIVVIVAAAWWLPVTTWLELIGVMLAAGMASAVAGWMFALRPIERARMLAVVRSRARRH